MKISRFNRLALLAVVVLASSFSTVSAQEAIVITYKQNLLVANPRGKNLPIKDSAAVEAACVATALARNLQMYAGTSHQEVAMFPALAGVKLANERYLIETRAGAEACYDPGMNPSGYYSDEFEKWVPEDYTLLIDLVRQYLNVAKGRMIVCPLCWVSREYDNEDLFEGAEIGTSTTVGPLFVNAQKVIDF
ncbi:MAG: DsrE family protein [Chromatiaceae bacterium]|nr:DsrE family protein [Chromatiaceae bacterium]MBP8290278.1 DsrE family protein [Chromatiaceae bacterium]MBP9603709.1 DsrE family protein [Chromatiaceae bacterium]